MEDRLFAELCALSGAFGAPGFEGEVAGLYHRMLGDDLTWHRDRLGSLAAELPGDGPRILLAAHLDEVGFMVKAITPDGFLRFITLGGWWSQTVLAGPVRIKGSRGEVRGVIGSKPPHFLKEKERKELVALEDMFIDVGAASREEAMALGLAPGDPVVPDVQPVRTADGKAIIGKALDDRAGVLAMAETIRQLRQVKHANVILAGATVQEEIGARGARTLAQMLHPDLCLVIEGTPADDSPGFSRDLAQGVMGRGPQIRYIDPTMVACRPLADLARAEAERLGIPYQIAVRDGGGTDGGQIHMVDLGVPTLVIGVPVRYSHSYFTLSSLDDIRGTIDLLTAMLPRLDHDFLASLA